MDIRDVPTDHLRAWLVDPGKEHVAPAIRRELERRPLVELVPSPRIPLPAPGAKVEEEPARKRAPRRGVPKSHEIRFREMVLMPRVESGEILRIMDHEGLTFRMPAAEPDDVTTVYSLSFSPDWPTVAHDGTWWMHEVKGKKPDAAGVVRFRNMARHYRHVRWTMWVWNGQRFVPRHDFKARPLEPIND